MCASEVGFAAGHVVKCIEGSVAKLETRARKCAKINSELVQVSAGERQTSIARLM